MDRTPVQSTELRSVGYDPSARRLEVEFRDGALYEYLEVPESEWTALMQAPSHGRHFNQHIRNGPYRYRRL